jgi:hypothetical protein
VEFAKIELPALVRMTTSVETSLKRPPIFCHATRYSGFGFLREGPGPSPSTDILRRMAGVTYETPNSVHAGQEETDQTAAVLIERLRDHDLPAK